MSSKINGIIVDDGEILSRNRRPRILALHGEGSNSTVTKLQLENLQINEDMYDIFFLNGITEVKECNPDLKGLINGPFFSWLHEDKSKSYPLVVKAVHHVLLTVSNHGPFDGIYGFSSGGVIAAMASGIGKDSSLLNKLHAVNSHSEANFDLILRKRLFHFGLFACSATSYSSIVDLRRLAGLDSEFINPGYIDVPSFHLIGVNDVFKSKSEEIVTLFSGPQVNYLSGGHSIDHNERFDEDLHLSLSLFLQTLGSIPSKEPMYKHFNHITSIAKIPSKQIALVKINREKLPCDLCGNQIKPTIKSFLKAQPQNKPFIYNARSNENKIFTTYGDISNFICGGYGDLRCVGVKSGEIVAYCVPSGGSAVAVTAFLSIASQAIAYPLDPDMTASEALYVLSQLNIRHLILFEGVHCPGVQNAFSMHVDETDASIHKAVIDGENSPGMFKYNNSCFQDMKGEQLVNSEDSICLLLRTSGTTSKPKIVPLTQGSLVTNGAIIAASMQLTDLDVCYSVMPLFHIGGISASILCTLTSGGSICCDNKSFEPGRMVDAISISNPQPTWYSSVPTIHNSVVAYLKNEASKNSTLESYGVDSSGIWRDGHSLRMIRSGAASLLDSDGIALSSAFGGIPIYPTYSMSEQMPISQPPAGKKNMLCDKPGSVGLPVAASTAIVNSQNLRLQPPGIEGEIAISGPTVMKHYLGDTNANNNSFFFLTLEQNNDKIYTNEDKFFLTGDIGLMDSEGFLMIKGRSKEIIKKGGKQISPFEVEAVITQHPWVSLSVCFPVPSITYGEEIGCAIVLSPSAPIEAELRMVTTDICTMLKSVKLTPTMWPTKWKLCNECDIPKTKTKKFIRIGLAKHLNIVETDTSDFHQSNQQSMKAAVDWDTIRGLRFCLSCFVMFMHIGSNESWSRISHLRGFPWHVHVFFTVGGYFMALPMNPLISKKKSYVWARFGTIYPTYLCALIFSTVNLLIVCRPSTFRKDFHWDAQPNDLWRNEGDLSSLFCEGTPVTPNSYWASLILTILTYIFGLAVTPFWPLSWWLGYYLWFSSIYFQCIAVFPSIFNYFYKNQKQNVRLLLKTITTLFSLNAVILSTAWLISKDFSGYNHYDKTGAKNPKEDYTDGSFNNALVLSFYLFGPFWILYFSIGICLAFLYHEYRPREKNNASIWGYIADGVTFTIFVISILHMLDKSEYLGSGSESFSLRPMEANDLSDTAVINRIWDNIYARFFCPLTTLWIFALSTGQGYTSLFLKSSILKFLSPHTYNCFLFHQVISQWYYAATRKGLFWNWWRYRKDMYWFSPKPCPVNWYEYFIIVGIVIAWSHVIDLIMPCFTILCINVKRFVLCRGNDESSRDPEIVLCDIIAQMTGIEPQLDWTLNDCGLASMGLPIIVGILNERLSISVPLSSLTPTVTIKEIADKVNENIEELNATNSTLNILKISKHLSLTRHSGHNIEDIL